MKKTKSNYVITDIKDIDGNARSDMRYRSMIEKRATIAVSNGVVNILSVVGDDGAVLERFEVATKSKNGFIIASGTKTVFTLSDPAGVTGDEREDEQPEQEATQG